MNDTEQEIDYSGFTFSEKLTANFYQWEHRGRGWQVWDAPVELEPPFVPFFFDPKFFPPAVDDGQYPSFTVSLLKRAWKGLRGLLKTGGDGGLAPLEESDYENGAIIFLDDSPLHELILSPVALQKVEMVNAERFLLTLKYCSLPMGFEIIGTRESILVQIVCREPDLRQVRKQLKAHFPDLVLYEEGETLRRFWDSTRQTKIIDYGLSNEFMRSLSTFKNFEPDPLTGIIGAMEDLEKNELAIFQVLFQESRSPWTKSILRSVTDGRGHSFFVDSPEMVRLAEEKVGKPLFGAVVRAVGQSNSFDRAWEIAKTVGSGLSLVANPYINELIPLENDYYDDILHVEDVSNRETHRSGMLLNSEELVSFVHPPSISVRSHKLRRELKKTKAPPATVSGHQIVLGENIHQGRKTTVTVSPEQRFKHMHIIGATGTGKSTLLLQLIVQDIIQGSGIGVLDPHGDLIDRILGYIPEERFDDVVLIDPSDIDYPVGLNILSSYSELDKTVLASDLISVFRRLSTSWGDQMNSIFGNAILAFLESEAGGTLGDLRRFLVEKEYRDRFLRTVRDREVLYYWQKEFPVLTGRVQAPILTRLDTFLRPKPIRVMVNQREGLNFQEIVDGRKIFLAKLAQGLIGMENAYLLGSIIVSKLHQAAMARQAKLEREREGFYLFVDEFQNFATESMTEILSGARKYNFGLVLAHQEMQQLMSRNRDLANSVISNPGTRICFRLGDFDAKKLEEGFSYFDFRDLLNLGIGEAIVRIERADYDFNIKTMVSPQIDPEVVQRRRERVVELSREKYAYHLEKSQSQLAWEETQESDEAVSPVPESTTTEVKEEKAISRPPAPSEKPARKTALAKAELEPEEQSFLKFIGQHPDMFITKVYQALRLSGYKGDKIKTSLIEKGLIVQEETRKGLLRRLAKVLSLTDKGSSAVKNLSLAGKGGDLHKDHQYMVKEQAELFGWRAKLEERIPRSLESVDVGLDKDGIRVAVEISSTTPPEHEVQNIRKCLDAGYDYILAVSDDDKRLSQLKTEVKKAFSFKERERVRFYHVSRVKEFLSGIGPQNIVSENGIVSDQIRKQKQLMDSTEAAEFLGISKNTLYEWTSQKKVPYIKVGGLLKFKRDDLEGWLVKRTQEEEDVDISDDI